MSLNQLQELCTTFNISFSINTDGSSIFYNFGPITWQKLLGNEFNNEDFYKVSLKLAATFPEKVLI